MNERVEQIMADYGNADFNKRLGLYLQYPSLRSAFIVVEQDDGQAGHAFDSKRCIPSLADLLNELARAIASGVKKVVGVGST